ncbi:hypothetical protein [Scytonema sp. PCC 10023]|uniref:hypothetical protein n=1 Tax=Scytonema sp. PCC 10023 TaxID=1680591 RepID=UPI0039C5BCBA
MEYYLNERFPYQRNKAIACYYTYEDTCILKGKVDDERKLIVYDELWFGKDSTKEQIAQSLKSYSDPWINKNDYFAQVVGYCYYLNFRDEDDIAMLTDEFQELHDNDRFLYEGERTGTKHRDKCLQILVKALSYALNSRSIGGGSLSGKSESFRNPFKNSSRNGGFFV